MPTTNLGRVRPIYRGLYSAATAYRPLDFVTFNGVTYFCIANTTGNAPTNVAFWQALTAGGLADFGVTATAAQLNVLTGIPALSGNGSRFLRANAGATALEYRTPAQVRSDLSINGIGSETAPAITNLDTLTVGGTYHVPASTTGAPVTEWGIVVHYPSSGSQEAAQEFFSSVSDRRWGRREFGGVWQAWVQVQGAIGFTPVEQGGGANMGTNKVRIGWQESEGGALLQIDATTLGLIALRQEVPTWANTMGTIAAQPAGSVGTYALLMNEGVGANINIGDLVAGSNLRYVAASGTGTAGVTPSGTWRCMGLSFASYFAPDDRTTLFLRIS
jgi:hypothetical protein